MERDEAVSRLITEIQEEGITDPLVLGAIQRVPREFFVPPELRDHAYRNIPLPIGGGQTISQPFVVALMTQSLVLRGDDRALEIGTGSGYQTAVLAELCANVVSVERMEDLARAARGRLVQLGYSSVEVIVGDGSMGYPGRAPYDAIIVTAASPAPPPPLLEQLAEGGRLVLPVGSPRAQELMLYGKQGGEMSTRRLGPVRFVPLIGQAAWNEAEASRFVDAE